MIVKLLSGDRPRSKMLSAVLLLILFGLLFAPFLFPGTRSLDTAARICIFIVLVASYDYCWDIRAWCRLRTRCSLASGLMGRPLHW